MPDRLNWIPTPGGWRQGVQHFTWADADYHVKWDSGLQLCKGVKDNVTSALSAALGGVWHEARLHSVFEVGELCVRCGEAVEDLEHIVHHCPAWATERRGVKLPASVREY
eukprot:3505825-Amphidinium_carterae.2